MPSINYAYVNGRFLPEPNARVSIFDRGFLHGDGVFETMRVYGGRIFCRLAHLDRLAAGLARLGIPRVFSPEELRAVCRLLIARNQIGDGVARVYQTRDSLAVTAQARTFAPRALTAMVSDVRIDPQLSGFKTASRLPYILALRQAAAAGVDEAVLLNHAGRVVEFANSNLFLVRAGELWTPSLSDGPLPGIARHTVIALAREQRIAVHEASLRPAELTEADEVFATNSLLELAPVKNWSRQSVLTDRLAAAYRKLVATTLAAGGAD